MQYGQVRLKRGEETDLRGGGCWVYDNEVLWVDHLCENGAVVDVTAHDGAFLGRGFFNGDSKIVVRLLTRPQEPINEAIMR